MTLIYRLDAPSTSLAAVRQLLVHLGIDPDATRLRETAFRLVAAPGPGGWTPRQPHLERVRKDALAMAAAVAERHPDLDLRIVGAEHLDGASAFVLEKMGDLVNITLTHGIPQPKGLRGLAFSPVQPPPVTEDEAWRCLAIGDFWTARELAESLPRGPLIALLAARGLEDDDAERSHASRLIRRREPALQAAGHQALAMIAGRHSAPGNLETETRLAAAETVLAAIRPKTLEQRSEVQVARFRVYAYRAQLMIHAHDFDAAMRLTERSNAAIEVLRHLAPTVYAKTRPLALAHSVRSLYYKGLVSEAMELQAEALAAEPDHPEHYLYLARMQAAARNPRGALATLEAGLALHPADCDLHRLNGELLLASGDSRAGEALHLANRYAPSHGTRVLAG